jgi:aconitate hydratase
MGVLPLQFEEGTTVESLGLTGEETFEIAGLEAAVDPATSGRRAVRVTAGRDGAEPVEIEARVRLDTPNEVTYYRHGGILQRVLRGLL